VDEPYGKGNTRPEQQDSFPGVSYLPTGHKFQFHVDTKDIPSDISRANEIEAVDRHGNTLTLGARAGADSVGEEEVKLRVKKPKKPPDEGNLAKTIWGSIRDRSEGVFDIEGVEPHEFMDHLFNEMDKQLDRSNIIKSPYPESWLGTNTVERLRNDPNKLGEVIERQYYAEKMKEYVEALKGKYMNNYMIPKVLLTTIEAAKIKYAKDPMALKTAFMDRLAMDAASPQLVTTNYILRPYAITIAIMRAIIRIPEGDRDAYVAGEIDDTMRRDIRSQMYHNLIAPILPKEHPLYEPRPAIPPSGATTPIAPPVAAATPAAATPAAATPAATPAAAATAPAAQPTIWHPPIRRLPNPNDEPSPPVIRLVDEPELPPTPGELEEYASIDLEYSKQKATPTDVENGRRMLQRDNNKLFKMQREPLAANEMRSLIDENFKKGAGITNRLGWIRSQGRAGTCGGMVAGSLQSWHEGKEKSGFWTYLQHQMESGANIASPPQGSGVELLLQAELKGGSPSEEDFPMPKDIQKDDTGKIIGWPFYTAVQVTQATNKTTLPFLKSTKEQPYLWIWDAEKQKDKQKTWEFMCSSIWHGIPFRFNAEGQSYADIKHRSPLEHPGFTNLDTSLVGGSHAMYCTGVGLLPTKDLQVYNIRDEPKSNPDPGYEYGKFKKAANKWVEEEYKKYKEKSKAENLDQFKDWFWDYKRKMLVDGMQQDYIEGKLPTGEYHGITKLAKKVIYAYYYKAKVLEFKWVNKKHYSKVQLGSNPANWIWIETKFLPVDLFGRKSPKNAVQKGFRSEPVEIKKTAPTEEPKTKEEPKTTVKLDPDHIITTDTPQQKTDITIISAEPSEFPKKATMVKFVQVVSSWGTDWGHDGTVWVPFDEWFEMTSDWGLIGFAEVTRPAEIVVKDANESSDDDDYDGDEWSDYNEGEENE
jgi:hypothetical protein